MGECQQSTMMLRVTTTTASWWSEVRANAELYGRLDTIAFISGSDTTSNKGC
jgi:hypothetical protein